MRGLERVAWPRTCISKGALGPPGIWRARSLVCVQVTPLLLKRKRDGMAVDGPRSETDPAKDLDDECGLKKRAKSDWDEGDRLW